jgi:hypothetical protein
MTMFVVPPGPRFDSGFVATGFRHKEKRQRGQDQAYSHDKEAVGIGHHIGLDPYRVADFGDRLHARQAHRGRLGGQRSGQLAHPFCRLQAAQGEMVANDREMIVLPFGQEKRQHRNSDRTSEVARDVEDCRAVGLLALRAAILRKAPTKALS